jgi:hypothetical protein
MALRKIVFRIAEVWIAMRPGLLEQLALLGTATIGGFLG